MEDDDLDEAEVFVPADTDGYQGPLDGPTDTPSQQRNDSNLRALPRRELADDAGTNVHYLDPPIRSSVTPSPRSVAA